MKKYWILLIGLLISNLLSAQSKIKQYTFSDRIYSINVGNDSTQQYLLISTRPLTKSGKYYKNKGNLILFNVETQKEQWRRPINYAFESGDIFPHGIIFRNNIDTRLLDFSDGKELWKIKGSPIGYDFNHNSFFWYQYSTWKDISSCLDYRDAQTGKVLWTAKVPHTYGWENYYPINDSTYCIQSDGIHLINVHNGSGYHYKAKTGARDFKNPLMSGIFGTLSGVFTGYAVIPIGDNHIKGLSSNIVLQDSCYYMADREGIFCLNDTLKELWHHDLPDGAASTSHIFTDSTYVYMVNYGIGDFRGEKSIGYPFIACFDRKKGKQIYFKQIAKAKSQIRDCFRKENTEYILFDDQLVCCDLKDSSKVNTISWDVQKYGKLKGIVRKNVYFANSDSTIFRKVSSDYYRILVYTETDNIYEVNKTMQVVASHSNLEYYTAVAEHNGSILLGADGKLFRINSLGVRQEIIENITYPVNCRGNHVYAISREKDKIFDITL